MTVILSKWQKQHLLTEVYVSTDGRYRARSSQARPPRSFCFLRNWHWTGVSATPAHISHLTASAEHLWPCRRYRFLGTRTLLLLTTLSGAVSSIMGKKKKVVFAYHCVCPYRRQCPPSFTVGVDVFIIGNSVSHNVYIQYRAAQCTCCSLLYIPSVSSPCSFLSHRVRPEPPLSGFSSLHVGLKVFCFKEKHVMKSFGITVGTAVWSAVWILFLNDSVSVKVTFDLLFWGVHS